MVAIPRTNLIDLTERQLRCEVSFRYTKLQSSRFFLARKCFLVVGSNLQLKWQQMLLIQNFFHKLKVKNFVVKLNIFIGRVRRAPDQLRLQAVHPAGRDVGRLRAAAEVDPAPHPPLPQPRHRRRRRPHILILALLLCQGALKLYYVTCIFALK